MRHLVGLVQQQGVHMPSMSQIDNFINKYKGDIDTLQADYFPGKGKYKQYKKGEFQGLDFVEVHEYVMPDGQAGYQIIIRADEPGGDIYYKSINVGPETYRDSDWTLYVEDFI